jgi:thiol-disulfide isomerase/thioredoxin
MESSAFKVPHRLKVIFVWFSIAAVLFLVGYQFKKRASYMRLHVQNLMQAEAVARRPAIDERLPLIFPSLRQSDDKRPVLYHFWATWCAPCRSEIPTLQELQKHFKGQLRVVTIAVDENKEDVLRFFGGVSPSFEVLWDQSQVVSELWGVQKFPESFFVAPGSERMIRFAGARQWNEPEVVNYVASLIAKKTAG